MGYQVQQLHGWRIFLPQSNEFIITAHASFEDHKAGVTSRSGQVSKNRYTKEELSSVGVGDSFGEPSGIGAKSRVDRGAISESLTCDIQPVESVEGYGTSAPTATEITTGYGAINSESDSLMDEYFRVSQSLKAGLSDTLSGTSNREGDMGNQPVLGVIGGLIPANSMVDTSSYEYSVSHVVGTLSISDVQPVD